MLLGESEEGKSEVLMVRRRRRISNSLRTMMERKRKGW